MSKISQSSKFNYSDMIDALNMMGFEPIELNFFRRIEELDDSSQLIIYCELLADKIEITTYRDAVSEDFKQFTDPLLFIDYIESTLKDNGIENIKLVPFDSSITINGKPITAADNRFTTKDFVKKLLRVKSSNIWSYAFQPKDYNKGDMLIQFKGQNGGPEDIYIYYDVPSKLWQKFVAAPSKGHFMWQHIRNVFKYAKLTGDKRTKLPNGI